MSLRVYVLVSAIPSANRSFQQQHDGVYVASGAVRISVAHRTRKCMYLRSAARQSERNAAFARKHGGDVWPAGRVVEIPEEWLEHALFEDLHTCSKCWRD